LSFASTRGGGATERGAARENAATATTLAAMKDIRTRRVNGAGVRWGADVITGEPRDQKRGAGKTVEKSALNMRHNRATREIVRDRVGALVARRTGDDTRRGATGITVLRTPAIR